MLKTRVITALVLLFALLLILYSNSYPLFALTAVLFFGTATWESFRLFSVSYPAARAAALAAGFLFIVFHDQSMIDTRMIVLFALSSGIWLVRMGPSLAMGLPPVDGLPNRILNAVYEVSILACFVAILILFKHSAVYLLSVLALVWIADIGAYFSGKTFGKNKLAPSISPGKTWEGAIGGWVAVVLISIISTQLPMLHDTFASNLLKAWGWLGFIPAMTLIVVASVVGDLFESQLKRRIAMKDSSNLLPGHGGILDRIDALIPVLPLALVFEHWF